MILFNENAEATKILDFLSACNKLGADSSLCLVDCMKALKSKQPEDALQLLKKLNTLLLTKPTSIAFNCDNRQQVLYIIAKYLWLESKKPSEQQSNFLTEDKAYEEGRIVPNGLEEGISKNARKIMSVLKDADQTMAALEQFNRLNLKLAKEGSEKEENQESAPKAERVDSIVAEWMQSIPKKVPSMKETELDIFDNQASLLSTTIKAYHDAGKPPEDTAATYDAEVPAEWAKKYPPEQMLLYLLAKKMAATNEFRVFPVPYEKFVVYGDKALRAAKTFYDRAFQCRTKPLIELKPFFNIYHIRLASVQEPETDEEPKPWSLPDPKRCVSEKTDGEELKKAVPKQARQLYTLQEPGCEGPPKGKLKLTDDGANGLYRALNRAYTKVKPDEKPDENHVIISRLMMKGELTDDECTAAVTALKDELQADLNACNITSVQTERNLTLISNAVKSFRTNAVMQMLLYIAMEYRGENADTGYTAAICQLADSKEGIVQFIQNGLTKMKEMTAKKFLTCRVAAVKGGILRVSLFKKKESSSWTIKIEENSKEKEAATLKKFLGRKNKEEIKLEGVVERKYERIPYCLRMWVQQGMEQIREEKLRGITKTFYSTGTTDYPQRAIFLLVLWMLESSKSGNKVTVEFNKAEPPPVFSCGETKKPLPELLRELWTAIRTDHATVDTMWDAFCTGNIFKIESAEGKCSFTRTEPKKQSK